jgi:hypothetical protein
MIRLCPVILGILLVVGCKRSGEGFSFGPTDYPKRDPSAGEVPGPKNSLALKFTRFVGDKTDRKAEFLITNHFPKEINNVEFTLHYLDNTGQEIEKWPLSHSSTQGWCQAGETIIDVLGFQIPDNAASVKVDVDLITFRDGTEWHGPFHYPKHGTLSVGNEEVAGPKDSLAFKFNRVVPDQKFGGRMAECLITNHFSKEITGVSLDIHYLDKTGQEINWGPWSHGGNVSYCKAGETIIDAIGLEAPENCSQVRVVVQGVIFRDGTEWKP